MKIVISIKTIKDLMSSIIKHQSIEHITTKRNSVKSMTCYPFHLRNSINLTLDINTLIKDKEEALKPLDYLDDLEDEETKVNTQTIIISERSSDSYAHILNDNIIILQKELYKHCKE